MGHNSFIKSFITQVSLGFCRYLGAALYCSYIWFGGGAVPLPVPVRAQSTPAAVAVMEVSSVELRTFLCLSFSHKSLVTPGMIYRTNNNFSRTREKSLFSIIMSTCNCAHSREMAIKVCEITPKDMCCVLRTPN